jgi:hypothetical protein
MSRKTCLGPECSRTACKLNLCASHYQQQHQGQALRPLRKLVKGPIAVRMAAYTDPEGPQQEGNKERCHLWTGALNNYGYGVIQLSDPPKLEYAHRVAWELVHEPIPPGLVIDHLCQIRSCVNVAHMELTTRGENSNRGGGPTGINSRKSQCKHGHPFTPTNTYWENNGKRRRCKRCSNRNSSERNNLVRGKKIPKEVIGEKDDWICWFCRGFVDKTLKYPDHLSPSSHHKILVKNQGSHTIDNLFIAHLTCNTTNGKWKPPS